jgi:sugar (pentulose or hexulose) kinase
VTLLAGLDVGTTSVKGLLVAPDGEVVARAHPSYRVIPTPNPSRAP